MAPFFCATLYTECLLTTVCVCLCVQGAEHIDLIPGGSEVAVNSSNVHDYVRKYAEYRMVKAVSKPLEVGTLFTEFLSLNE